MVDDSRIRRKNAAVKRRGIVAPRFGKWIVMLREFAHLKQEELAVRAEISVGQVRAVERGENVGLRYIQAVIRALALVDGSVEFDRIRRALDHEACRHMTADADDFRLLSHKKKQPRAAGEPLAPTPLRRRRAAKREVS